MKGFPVLVQLRLLDQKDPSTKLWCATGIDPLCASSAANKNSEHVPSLVWICSGTHSASEMMVIDASSGNHVMDQFVIPNNHVLCVTSVPAYRLDDLDTQQTEEEGCYLSSKEATVWLGTQEGSLFLHSAHSCWRNCIQKTQLKDAIYSITYASNRVIASLGDGTLAIFSRNADRKWDLENPKVVDFGRPQQSIRCCAAVQNEVWCGYRNRIYVVDPRTAKIKKWFEATPRTESQVRHLAAAREGVWVSVRLDSILRLFDAQTGQPLQELELEPFIHKMLGSSSLGVSMAQVSAMSIFCNRLFVGTTSGVILSVPFSRGKISATNQLLRLRGQNLGPVADTFSNLAEIVFAEQVKRCTEEDVVENVPHSGLYCSIEYAQVCFHGHRDAVKFFACVPGCINPSSSEGNCKSMENSSVLVMSGGEGYINFKIGDETGDTDEGYGELLLPNPRHRRSERSHLIVWQMQT
uniref:Uncharacterized protein n=1 Tax=Xenopus tropicalis TaxID=8364 RepID=A0A6I8SEI3_XENTR